MAAPDHWLNSGIWLLPSFKPFLPWGAELFKKKNYFFFLWAFGRYKCWKSSGSWSPEIFQCQLRNKLWYVPNLVVPSLFLLPVETGSSWCKFRGCWQQCVGLAVSRSVGLTCFGYKSSICVFQNVWERAQVKVLSQASKWFQFWWVFWEFAHSEAGTAPGCCPNRKLLLLGCAGFG